MNANEYTSLINNVVFNGNENNIKINSNSSNISQIKNGFNNNIYINERVLRNNQNSYQTFNFDNSNFSININGQNAINFFDTNQIFNIINNSINNIGMNINFGNYNQNNNQEEEEEYEEEEQELNSNQDPGDYYQEQLENEVEEEENEDNNNNNILIKKRAELILELDEFQYKNISKYSSRKEDSCAICLQKFKGTDIIKEFCCKHIFHKKCLLKWLQTSNICPLCKHNLMDDIK